MKRVAFLGFALALVGSALAACTMDFNQFQPGGGGAGGTGAGGVAVGAGGTGGSLCSGECCFATDCPVPADPCMQPACDDGTCIEAQVPDGSEVGVQTNGDCKTQVCQGGTPVSVDDEADVPNDGNDCTVDSCAGGNPQSDPAAAGTPCDDGGGAVCDGNAACVQCLSDTDCTDPTPTCDVATGTCISPACDDGTQNGDETDTDCGGSCLPCDVGQTCAVNADCTTMICNGSSQCANPSCNDGQQNGNETGIDCGGGVCPGCPVGQGCGGSDANCTGSSYCDMTTNLCASKKNQGAACSVPIECQSGQCIDGFCCNAACGGTCVACNLAGMEGSCSNIPVGQDPANECAGTSVCNGQAACKKPNGETCNGGGDCVSQQCADGVCCGTSCGGLCKACDLAGTEGTCTDVPAGTDPDNECSGTSVCNGAGSCQ
jgi:hypothetical protein